MQQFNEFQLFAINRSNSALARIREAAICAKEHLSSYPFHNFDVREIAARKKRPIHIKGELSRKEFLSRIEPLLDETFSIVQSTLKEADLLAQNIDEVILVGGSTRIPAITQRLVELFGKAPHCDINPDLCVAYGAAMVGGMINGDSMDRALIDVTPYTFGTSFVGELHGMPYPDVYKHIIEKNTPLPVSKSEVFFTTIDNQKNVNVKIYQGESDDALDNTLVGEFKVSGLASHPAGSPIVITLHLDANGMLTVTALEKITQIEKTITIENAFSEDAHNILYEEDDESMDNEIESYLHDASPETISGAKVKNIEALIKKALSIMNNLSEEDKVDLKELTSTLQAALNHQSVENIDETIEELQELLDYFECLPV